MAHKNGNSVTSVQNKINQAQEVRALLSNLSKMLNTGLSEEQLEICIQMCEMGVSPMALAEIVKQIRSQVADLKEKEK